MKRKILLIALVVVVATTVGSVGYAVAGPGGQVPGQQRLFGIGTDGATGMPTAPNVPPMDPPYYRILLGFTVVNPDLTYSKTLEKILIIDAVNQTWVYEVPLTEEMATLSPREGFYRDFEMLGISIHSIWSNPYIIEVYWSGKGQPLLGYICESSYLVDAVAPNCTVLDFGPIQDKREMVNLSP